MAIKFSEDLVPLADLKVNPGRVVKHTTGAHRPVLLTSCGRGVAVVPVGSRLREGGGRAGLHAGCGCRHDPDGLQLLGIRAPRS